MTISDYITRRNTPAAAAAAPVAAYDVDPDTAYRAAWGYALDEWKALTDSDRRDRRDRVVYAPHFSTEGK